MVKSGSTVKTKSGGDKNKTIQILLKYGVYLMFLLIVVLLLITNSSFRSLNNATNVMLQVSSYAVLGVGMTLVIMTGGIDVSVGATMVVSASVYAVLTQNHGWTEPAGLLMILAVALAMGLINGIGVAYLNMPAFLVTLATQCIGRGVSLVLTGGVSYRNLGSSFTFVGKRSILNIPVQIWIVVIIYVLGYVLLHCTVYGRKVMAVGGNANAAKVSGINNKRVILSTYVFLGIISGLAGFMTMARIGSYYAAMGDSMEFMVIAAAVIGGTSLAGGSGSIMGTLVGTLLIGVINNALNLFGVSAEWQDVAKGVVIFLAVLFDAVKNRMRSAE